MKKFPFKKINSFTDGKAEGAPAACVYLNGFNEITESEMFLIALELKDFVSEVVYLSRESGGIYLKYYSSGCTILLKTIRNYLTKI
jgi:predicted PhzF superfamily epimerase YddE/YHI9